MRFFIVAFFISISAFANNTFNEPTFKLEKHYKIIGSFSGDVEEKDSFHLLITKNKDTDRYEILPLMLLNDAFKQLKSISYPKQPSIVSYHASNGILSLVVSSENRKKKFIDIVDINLTTGLYKRSSAIDAENFKATIRKPKANYLVFSNNEEHLEILTVLNSKSMDSLKIPFIPETKAILEDISAKGLDVVNTDEYVDNGSINPIKVYLFDKDLVITKDNLNRNSTNIIKMPIDAPDSSYVEVKTMENNIFRKTKKLASFVYRNKLFKLLLNRNEMDVSMYDLTTKEMISLDINEDAILNKGKSFKGLSKFKKNASKVIYKPTITANATIDGNTVVRINYVDAMTYNYNDNWWWHHEWMWQQQIQKLSIPKGFGPHLYIEDYYFETKSSHFFEFVLDGNDAIAKQESTKTKSAKIDKKTYIDRLTTNKAFKHVSSAFLKNTFRAFIFSKEKKVFTIIDTQLND